MAELTDRPRLGSAYHTIIELRPDLHLALRDDVFAVRHGSDLVNVDFEGRLHRAWLDGDSYQRGLDGRVRRVHIERPEPTNVWLEIDLLDGGRRDAVFRQSLAMVEETRRALGADVDPAVREALDRASTWDVQRYHQEKERFHATYGPIPLIPPDQRLALVLEGAGGCGVEECLFCTAGEPADEKQGSAGAGGTTGEAEAESAAARGPRRGRHPHIVRFERHLEAVQQLLGRALSMRRGIFLSGAGFLHLEPSTITSMIRILHHELGGPDRWPLAAFLDRFVPTWSAERLQELRERGLSSVTIGIESGSEGIRAAVGKHEPIRDAIETMRDLRAAGIARGVITLLGTGGREGAGEHEERTVDALLEMKLDRRARVYLSPMPAARGAESDPLQPAELAQQADRMRARLRDAGVTAAIAESNVFKYTY